MILVEDNDWYQHTGWGNEDAKIEESKCKFIFVWIGASKWVFEYSLLLNSIFADFRGLLFIV
jgi:hypothetical protein